MNNFAILSIYYSKCFPIITITAFSSTPCHLTLYWSHKKPRVHPSARSIRGIMVPWHTYWCFVAYTPVEQTEAGDTLQHTFTVQPWEQFDIRYFAITGTVEGVESPSVSPIFKYRPGLATRFENGGFETWTDPLLLLFPWVPRTVGPGTGLIVRNSVVPRSGQHCMEAIATGQWTYALTRQYFCADNFQSKNVTLRAWCRDGQPGLCWLHLFIPATPGWNFTAWFQSPGAWRLVTHSFTLGMDAKIGFIEVGAYTGNNASTSGLWDDISFTIN